MMQTSSNDLNLLEELSIEQCHLLCYVFRFELGQSVAPDTQYYKYYVN